MEEHKIEFILKDHLEGAGLIDIAKQIKSITPKEALEDYEKLRSSKCSSINKNSFIGNKAMDFFFFKLRLKTKAKTGKSFYEWVQGTPLKPQYEKNLYQYNLSHGLSPMAAKLNVFNIYHGSINAFKPIVARDLFCKYEPTTVLDFSAGWGGRCLAAMSLDINYIGIDTNTNLKSAYANMIKAYPHNSKVIIKFQDSATVDYSKYKYDFVFSSPPYFQKNKLKEVYEKMPQYENREDFNERFFFPVVRNTMKHLAQGGHYALNIPVDMYQDIKTVLGKADKMIPFTMAKRYRGKTQGYKEYIYVWNKKAVIS